MLEDVATNLEGTFGLVVRFTVKRGREQDFDDLTAATVQAVQATEPRTLLYLCHRVDGAPQERIFYELYEDRSAFDAHETQAHVRHFLSKRDALLDDVAVDFLSPTIHARANR
jgi:quinol monooxygenase YgiN